MEGKSESDSLSAQFWGVPLKFKELILSCLLWTERNFKLFHGRLIFVFAQY